MFLGGEALSLSGAGFDLRICYNCFLQDEDENEEVSLPAQVLNTTNMVCTMPRWTHDSDTVVLGLRISGPKPPHGCGGLSSTDLEVPPFASESNTPSRFAMHLVHGWGIQDISGFLATGGSVVTLQGTKFDPADTYVLQLTGEGSRNTAKQSCIFESSASVVCEVSPWDHPAEDVKLSLLAGSPLRELPAAQPERLFT
eukprot:3723454-Rhodomonas_salina.1